jgi:hypothetical protein
MNSVEELVVISSTQFSSWDLQILRNIQIAMLMIYTRTVKVNLKVKWSRYRPGVAQRVGSQASQAKVLTGGRDLRKTQVDVPLSVSHSCVWPHCWLNNRYLNYNKGICLC